MASFLGKSVIIVDKVKKINQTSFCQNCDLVFGNEDLCKVHSCLAIKQENPDVIDFGKNAQDITNENFKIENQTAQHFQNLDSADPLHVENLGMLTKRDLYDALRSPTCPLVFGCWELSHVIFLMLRKKQLLAKLGKFTK